MDLDTYIQQIESIAYQVAVNSDGNKVRIKQAETEGE
jgi:hypothetical protein